MTLILLVLHHGVFALNPHGDSSVVKRDELALAVDAVGSHRNYRAEAHTIMSMDPTVRDAQTASHESIVASDAGMDQAHDHLPLSRDHRSDQTRSGVTASPSARTELTSALETSGSKAVDSDPEKPDSLKAKDSEKVFGVEKKTLENVMGPVGFTLALLMFLSSIPVVRRIQADKSVGKFSAFPYCVQVSFTYLTVLYCWSDEQTPMPGGTRGLLWAMVTNGVGFFVPLTTLYFFFYYAESEPKRTASKWLALCATPVLILTIVQVIMSSRCEGGFCKPGVGPRQKMADITGRIMLVWNIAMYTGPLACLREAWVAQSTRYMPLSLGVSTMVNSCAWFLYGIGISNLNIWVPNACGIVFGLIQILMFCYLKFFGQAEGDFHTTVHEVPGLQQRNTMGNVFDLPLDVGSDYRKFEKEPLHH